MRLLQGKNKMDLLTEEIHLLPMYLISNAGVVQIEDSNIETTLNVKTPGLGLNKNDRFIEGGIRQICIEIKARNPKLRAQAIANNKGYSCYICGFNFEDIYGECGANYIEIHHKIPLATSFDKRTVTVSDVVLVCANCHRVLHRNGKEPMRVEMLKEIVEERRRSKVSISSV